MAISFEFPLVALMTLAAKYRNNGYTVTLLGGRFERQAFLMCDKPGMLFFVTPNGNAHLEPPCSKGIFEAFLAEAAQNELQAV